MTDEELSDGELSDEDGCPTVGFEGGVLEIV